MDRSIAPTFETRLPQALAGEQSDALSAERGCRRETYSGARLWPTSGRRSG